MNGMYAAQTNSDEADAVVKLLDQYWRRAARPSIGVVTFNRKQADLIEARLEARAEVNERFRSAYAHELNRFEDGEDKGFFVKNVENAQGDERDVVIFRPTLGRDQHGAFRRYFGVLGQRGGERRLNVAISRARQKVVVVTSIPVADLSDMLLSGRPPSLPRDFLQGYLHYAEQVSKGNLETARSTLNQTVGNLMLRPRSEASSSDGFAATVRPTCASWATSPYPQRRDGLRLGFRHSPSKEWAVWHRHRMRRAEAQAPGTRACARESGTEACSPKASPWCTASRRTAGTTTGRRRSAGWLRPSRAHCPRGGLT